jgi:hypothetical protein
MAQVRQALDLARLYPEPRVADAADRAALARLNDRDPEPGCDSCARVVDAQGRRRWEPIDGRLANPTTVGGVLDQPVWLCRWCYDACRDWRRLPTLEEVTRRAEGQRVPWPADVPRPA